MAHLFVFGALYHIYVLYSPSESLPLVTGDLRLVHAAGGRLH